MPSTASTPRQPRRSPMTPEAEAPKRLPVMEPAKVRPIATCRFSGATRSLVRLSAIGNTPPEPMPARIRVANNTENDDDIAPRIFAQPSSTRQPIISRVLPNKSAAAPSTGCTIANVKANTAAKPAAVAMLTPNSSATCGNTGSSARAERLAAKVASAMMFRTGGMRASSWPQALSASSTRHSFGEHIERHQRPYQSFEVAQRHHVGPVRRRGIGIGMGLDEHAGDADRDRRARQNGYEFAFAARRSSFAAGLLHRMGGIEDHRRTGGACQD